jgi:predicted RecA/RadA family phage recombinase
MANPDTPNGFTLVRSDYGQAVVVHYPVAASQTIAKGDAVILSSGLVNIAVATSGALLGVAAASITTGASVTRDDTVPVWVALPGHVFEGQCSGSTVASTLGSECDIEGATGVMEVNENASVEDVLQIVRLRSDYDIDLALGANDRVEFVIKRSQYVALLAAI